MNPRTALRLAHLCALALVVSPIAALAAPEDGVRLYHDGLQAYGAGNADAARTLFQSALRELPNGHQLLAPTYYNLGRLAEQQGDPCEAARRLGDYLQVATATHDADQRRIERARTDEVTQRAACEKAGATSSPGGASSPRVPDERAIAARSSASSGFVVGLSLAEGVLIHDEVQRTHVAPEVTAGHHWGGLLAEMALVMTVKSSTTVIFRPGARLDMVEIGEQSATYVRAAGQFMATPLTTSGILLAPGARIGLGAGWAFTAEVDASLWFVAPAVIPLELRLGVAHAF